MPVAAEVQTQNVDQFSMVSVVFQIFFMTVNHLFNA